MAHRPCLKMEGSQYHRSGKYYMCVCAVEEGWGNTEIYPEEKSA